MAKRPNREDAAAPPVEPRHGGPGVTVLLPLLCLIGAGLAAYLTAIHYRLWLGNLGLGEACREVGGGDCNAVVASRFGELAGLPVAVWGLGYYLAAGALSVGSLALRDEDTPPLDRALWWLTVAALAFDAYLGWAMTAKLGRLCPLCLATYAVNLAILALAAVRRARVKGESGWRLLPPRPAVLANREDPRYYRDALKALLSAVAAVALAVVFGGALMVGRWADRAQESQLERLLEFARTAEAIDVPTEGRPSVGPLDAKVTLVVFSDFLCAQCRRLSRYLDIVAANHRDDVRVVYRQLPGEFACNPSATESPHPGACRMAAAGECAWSQGRFWPFHDAVFGGTASITPEKLDQYATAAGLDRERFRACLEDPEVMRAVRQDIDLAHRLGVTATPTLFINGRAVVGALKPRLLERAIRVIGALPLPGAGR
jgi:protein-disulfide isomerase/uncharacterized membrane protein